jgi:glycosyltransferase involved in cell wall biosynthesis
MMIVYFITGLLILLYLTYPLWLLFFPKALGGKREYKEIETVSVILLSYNGRSYLREKILFLLDELSSFRNSELIIIDDCSTDGSRDILREFEDSSTVKLILKEEQKGIPDTMNNGVAMAQYPVIVFCDQRQLLSNGTLKRLVEPLKYKNTGAVSSCISHIDKDGCCSWIRKFENLIKSRQSRTGSLIGVYGPLYAIKKRCYSPIPANIILDDLYLSLKILQSDNVILNKECHIRDDNFSTLSTSARAKRYLQGFTQLLWKDQPVRTLGIKHFIMLFFHKYLRLLLPPLLLLSYLVTGIKAFKEEAYLFAFAILSIIGIAALIPGAFGQENRIKGILKLNLWYLVNFPWAIYRKDAMPDKISMTKTMDAEKEGTQQ